MKAENFTEEFMELGGTKVRVVTYQIGDDYYCHVYSIDPGATIARSTASNRETVKEEAIGKAQKRILRNTSGH